MRTTLALVLLVTGFSAAAATGPTILSVTGASGFSAAGTPTIFGGLAGVASACGAGDAYTPCNSCVSAALTCTKQPLCPCNTSRIYDSLNVVIALSNQTKDANGNVTTQAGNAIVTSSTTSSVTVSQQFPNNNGGSVTLLWRDICAQTANAPATCEGLTSTTVTLNIYIDTNGNGIADSGEPFTPVNFKIIDPGTDTYSTFGYEANDGIGTFTPYPGDTKLYVKDPQTASNFPTLSYGSVVKNVRVYLSDQNLTDAQSLAASKTTDLAVSDDGSSLGKNIVDGLDNGTRYFMRLAMLDEASNVVQYVPDPTIDADAGNTECTSPSGASPGCKYSAIPDEVRGLLPNDLNCFVATAAYGSFLEPKLRTFRAFRNQALLPYRFGRRLVQLYYHYGPIGARFIADKPAWRAAARAALWPAFVLSWAWLRVGTLAMICLLALPVVLIGQLHRRVPRSRV